MKSTNQKECKYWKILHYEMNCKYCLEPNRDYCKNYLTVNGVMAKKAPLRRKELMTIKQSMKYRNRFLLALVIISLIQFLNWIMMQFILKI